MIWLKMIGALLTVGGASLMGFYAGNLESYRIADLQEFKKALAVLKSEIEFSRAALPECLRGVADRVSGAVADIFLRMSELLRQERMESVSHIAAKSLDGCERRLYLKPEDKEQFLSFGQTLGYLDLQMQLSSIRIFEQYINDTIARLNAAREKNQKMFGSLGVLSGLLIVVIFIV